ncbi:MAG: hypothetical protein CM1200mP30_19350 [Pseudomonadota bacterium]|nr:MAG: hypothetical protein CM1200mP30_19350 [Pseudomonadota bacterium]
MIWEIMYADLLFKNFLMNFLGENQGAGKAAEKN